VRSFMQKTRGRGAYLKVAKGVRILNTPCYQEVENPLDDGSFGVVYVTPAAGHAYSVHACVPNDIAVILNAFVALDPQRQRAAVEVYKQTWPLLATWRSNGLARQYLPVAVMEVEDPDNGINRWALTTFVGNLGALSGAETLKDVRVVEALLRVSDSSEALIRQISSTPMDNGRLAHAHRHDSAMASVQTATKLLVDNTGPIIKLFKLFSGVGQPVS
jgi:hypothetical protein